MAVKCTPEVWDRETNPTRAAHMEAESYVALAQEQESFPGIAAGHLEAAVATIDEVIATLEERLSGWQGTGLENSAQYEACDSTKSELEQWRDDAESLASDLAELETEPEEEDELEEWQADVDDAMGRIEDIPELDLGA